MLRKVLWNLGLISLSVTFVGGAVVAQTDNRVKPLTSTAILKTIRRLEPIHKQLGEPEPGDWLATQEENGQTYRDYRRMRPNILTKERNILYVQPIGEFSGKQKELIKLSAEFLGLYYNCRVKTMKTKSESVIPANAKRQHPSWGDNQLLTSYILKDVLAPELPRDAFATIAFTSSDLWPGEGWNFVFGVASFRNRVGVWSLYRHGDPEKDAKSFRTCLQRTIKVATHETGHMFSMKHCIGYECNMQGSNSLPESDKQPLYLCPECHAKVLYASAARPAERFERLANFCEKHGLSRESDYFKKASKTIAGNQN